MKRSGPEVINDVISSVMVMTTVLHPISPRVTHTPGQVYYDSFTVFSALSPCRDKESKDFVSTKYLDRL